MLRNRNRQRGEVVVLMLVVLGIGAWSAALMELGGYLARRDERARCAATCAQQSDPTDGGVP